jgi:prepilin-type N-terminal cleavage/methylation domain-containing protein
MVIIGINFYVIFYMPAVFGSVRQQGFTLMELMVGIGIFLLVIGGISGFFVTGIRSNRIIWSQLASQSDGRKVLSHVVDDVRRADVSSIGAYPIISASSTELAFYANVDDDSAVEQVRFWFEDGIVYKGVVHPAGIPLSYQGQPEQVVVISRDVVNNDDVPFFTYYDQTYTGTSTPLAMPVVIPDIRMVGVTIEIEEDPLASPVPLRMQSMVQIRNLKQQ